MNNKAILFDLDGVICHTDGYHYMAWKALADKLGIYFDEELNNLLRGVSRMESLDIVLEQRKTPDAQKKKLVFSLEEKLRLANEKNELYKALLTQMSPKDLSYEVKSTLEELRDRGHLLAIGSSSKNTPFILSKIGLEDYFDAVCDGNHITHSKPHPEVFQKAADMLHVPHEVCLVVEDAISGIEAACAAGMASAALGDACKIARATYYLKTFSDLLSLKLHETAV